jgi:hypothetical protein
MMKIKFEFGRKNRKLSGQAMAMIMLCFIPLSMQYPDVRKTNITIRPQKAGLVTETIQQAIDSCAATGGGVVLFPPGTYLTGGIRLKNNVALKLEKGAILRGSAKYSDYDNDAFIFGKDLLNIAILGEGAIDGGDCYNPKGEEGFRGPHCIRLINCRNITLKGFTIINSANWAINCRHCSHATVDTISIRGGHDGLHTRFCDNFAVTGCDFRTGDDAFAGNDNRDFTITDCRVNSSCNGFRMGCCNLTVKHCRFWGPGEYIHKIQKRNNMLAAFVHFSPKDENPELPSGNWLIQDVTIENVDRVYMYNHENGLWQTGRPVTTVRFERIKATGVLCAFYIRGDTLLKFNMYIHNSSFSFREGAVYNSDVFEGAKLRSTSFFTASNFNRIELSDVTIEKSGTDPVLNCSSGNSLMLERIDFDTGNSSMPYLLDRIKEVKKKDLRFNRAAGSAH